MTNRRVKLYKECETQLRQMLNQYDQILHRPLEQAAQVSEMVDRAEVEIENVNEFFFRGRLRGLLPQIQLALKKISDGTYGVCEETGELISEKRLRALPWTTLSLNGATIRGNTQGAWGGPNVLRAYGQSARAS